VWDIRTWRLVRAIPGTDTLGPGDDHQVFMVQLAVASTGHEMATTAGSHISLWDLATGRRIAQWSAGTDQPGVVALTPDGRTSLTGNADGSVSEWDTTSHNRIARFVSVPSTVRALAVSPDGTTVAVAGQDPTVSIDAVHGGAVVAILHGYSDGVDDLAFGADGSHLVRAGADGAALWWDLDPVRAVVALCQAVRGPTLSQAWRQTSDAADIGPPPC
jgi:WD40 repeat protein